MELWLPGLLVLLGLILLRMPIAYAMLLVGFGGLVLWYANDEAWMFADFGEFYDFALGRALYSVQVTVWETGFDYGLSVVPLFILMGNFVAVSGLSDALYRTCHAWLGHLRGGLAMATIVSCGGFSAVCGSSLATAATMSKIALPSMRRYGYADSLATGSIAAGGTLGILIPPSVVLIIYGIITTTNIGQLFIAGILPGIVGIIGYLIAVLVISYLRPEVAPAVSAVPWAERWRSLTGVLGISGLFILVIGGIYFGWFTTTEAAGIGASGAFALAVLSGRLSFRRLMAVLAESVQTTAMLFTILIGALVFKNFVNFAGLPNDITALFSNTDSPPLAIIMSLVLVYVVLGMLLESLSMMLLTVPILYPLIDSLNYVGPFMGLPDGDLIWFGIFVVVVTEISLITPPVGLNVFVLKSVLPDVRIGTIFRGVFPFIIADIVRLAIIVLIPALSLVLPALM